MVKRWGGDTIGWNTLPIELVAEYFYPSKVSDINDKTSVTCPKCDGRMEKDGDIGDALSCGSCKCLYMDGHTLIADFEKEDPLDVKFFGKYRESMNNNFLNICTLPLRKVGSISHQLENLEYCFSILDAVESKPVQSMLYHSIVIHCGKDRDFVDSCYKNYLAKLKKEENLSERHKKQFQLETQVLSLLAANPLARSLASGTLRESYFTKEIFREFFQFITKDKETIDDVLPNADLKINNHGPLFVPLEKKNIIDAFKEYLQNKKVAINPGAIRYVEGTLLSSHTTDIKALSSFEQMHLEYRLFHLEGLIKKGEEKQSPHLPSLVREYCATAQRYQSIIGKTGKDNGRLS